jgi:hypothetical protein
MLPVPEPLTLHVTTVLVVPETLAVNVVFCPTTTMAVRGSTVTVTGVGVVVVLPPPQPMASTMIEMQNDDANFWIMDVPQRRGGLSKLAWAGGTVCDGRGTVSKVNNSESQTLRYLPLRIADTHHHD